MGDKALRNEEEDREEGEEVEGRIQHEPKTSTVIALSAIKSTICIAIIARAHSTLCTLNSTLKCPVGTKLVPT